MRTRTRLPLLVLGAPMPAGSYHLDYVSCHISMSKLGIFFDIIHDCVEVYMDDFIFYGNTYQEALDNLEKALIICQEMNLSLSHEKCKMLLTEGLVLGHHVSFEGIKVDPAKIEFIFRVPPP
jgi:hypothetical protein